MNNSDSLEKFLTDYFCFMWNEKTSRNVLEVHSFLTSDNICTFRYILNYEALNSVLFGRKWWQISCNHFNVTTFRRKQSMLVKNNVKILLLFGNERNIFFQNPGSANNKTSYMDRIGGPCMEALNYKTFLWFWRISSLLNNCTYSFIAACINDFHM